MQTLTNKTIIIIDKEGTRRIPMIEAFRHYGEVYSFDTNHSLVLTDKKEKGEWLVEENVQHFDLILIHAGDKDKGCNAGLTFKQRVWYGGEEGWDPRAELGEEQVCRKIMHKGQCLSIDEVGLLMGYFYDKSDRPGFLCDAGHLSKMNAAIKLLQQLEFLDLNKIEGLKFPKVLSDCESTWNNFRVAAIKLLQTKPDISPFDPRYIELLTTLKTCLFK